MFLIISMPKKYLTNKILATLLPMNLFTSWTGNQRFVDAYGPHVNMTAIHVGIMISSLRLDSVERPEHQRIYRTLIKLSGVQ